MATLTLVHEGNSRNVEFPSKLSVADASATIQQSFGVVPVALEFGILPLCFGKK